MENSSSIKASITLPAELSEKLKRRAEVEHRSVSGIIQEAARYYIRLREFEDLQAELSAQGQAMGLQTEDDVDDLLHG